MKYPVNSKKQLTSGSILKKPTTIAIGHDNFFIISGMKYLKFNLKIS